MSRNIYTAIDACVNRAIEGLRVCEDIFRFAVHNGISSQFKELRHSIREAVNGIPVSWLLDARDIESDSQKFIDTAAEQERSGLPGVFRANIRRAAEAVRSLEELSKIDHPGSGALFQSIRFRLYEVEKKGWFIIQRSDLIESIKDRLCVIIDASLISSDDIGAAVDKAAGSGAGVIILRIPGDNDNGNLSTAKNISAMCAERDMQFFVCGRPDIAVLSGARGLCLDRNDIPAEEAARITGRGILLGLDDEYASSADRAVLCDVDFVLFRDRDNTLKLKAVESFL